MSFVKTVVSRPTTIFIVFVLLIMLGVFAWVNLPLDLTPEITMPFLLVMTTYTGASPEEVERTVTRTVESAVYSVSNLEEVSSTSSSGSSMVQMSFSYGTDLVDATNSVRDALDRIRNYLPDGVDPPTIFKFNPSMMPIMMFQLTGNRSQEELREFAENTVVPRIEQVDGVAQASVMGGRQRIIKVEIPQSRLEAYGLTITNIQQMLATQNQQTAAGTITEQGMNYILTTMGEFNSIDQIKNAVISYKGGGVVNGAQQMPRQVYLRDIADVTESYRDETSAVYVNGSPAVQLTVNKQSGKNTVQVARALRARVAVLMKEMPPDLELSELMNTADIVQRSINEVANTAITGGILAVVVLFIFLRSIKPTLIIGISIPVSIVITLMLMYFSGLTLNLMTLAGLVLGVGMLVDNSVVILENIYHYREKGAKLSTAGIIGTQEMVVAIAGSTLTTICVFAPLVMFQGLLEMAGELFAGLAFTVVISLGTSLFVAVFLVPVLASHYFPLVTRKQKALTGPLVPVDNAFEKFFTGLTNAYRKAVDRVIRFRWAVIGVLVVLFIGAVLMIPRIGWVFMPEQDEDTVTVNVMMPVGTALPETEAVLHQLGAIVEREIQGYERVTLNAGGGGMFGGGGSNSGSVRINLPEKRLRIDDADMIREKIRAYQNNFPGAMIYFSSGGMGGMSMMGGSSAIDVVLHTDDLVKGKEMAAQIQAVLRQYVPEVTEPMISLNDGLPQYQIQLDRERLYALGLNTYTVGNEIRAAVDGVTATRYKSGGHDYDVVLMLDAADRSTRPALDRIFVNSTMTGQRIPLSSFASYIEGTGPLSIVRENQTRTIHVTANARPGVKVNDLEAKVRAVIAQQIPADNDVIISIEGSNQEMLKMIRRFVLIVAVAVGLVFGIMASLFESFRDPFIVILTIPLSVIGIVLVYLITGDVFNILTAVGLLVLVGVIVNNGIVLVDYTNMLRKRGLSLHDACVEAAGNRLRPILMTTLTTVLGLVPMAFNSGEGSQMTGPIGKTVFGGLSFGTLMTLFLMPAVYYIINKRSDERAARWEARRERIAAGMARRKAKKQDPAEQGPAPRGLPSADALPEAGFGPEAGL